MGFVVSWIDADGGFIGRNGLLVLSLGLENISQVIIDLGIVRVDAERPLKCLGCLIQHAAVKITAPLPVIILGCFLIGVHANPPL